MSNTMRRIQAYKKATQDRQIRIKFQRVYLKSLIQHNKKRESK